LTVGGLTKTGGTSDLVTDAAHGADKDDSLLSKVKPANLLDKSITICYL
jgi:hypothetical protein